MRLSAAIDTALDRGIALGYGNVGLAVRRRLPTWPADPPPMEGRVVLVTGAATGIGLAAAEGFARLRASVRVLGRTPERAGEAAAEVRRRVPGADVGPVACDISSLAALEDFTARFADEEERLDVLVNNAGVMPPERTRSADGLELMFATHVLASWVLVDRLADLLSAASPGRVVTVSSGGMYGQRIPAGDLQSDRDDYAPKAFYARTKRMQVVLSEQWAARLAGAGVLVHAMHPGWVDTEGVRTAMPGFRAVTRPILRSAAEGADTIVWLGGAPADEIGTGGFWHDRRRRPTSYRLGPGEDPPQVRDELWRTCEELGGTRPG